ncbi:MAG: nitronate monooxygenase [Candidatus Marinimicrobia bacterium]|nr:nitronate monooxygenase [Candidatus Neomarinimicrobiota bacterium]
MEFKIFQPGNEFLKTKFPIICGAMSYISTPELVASVNENGGFGCLAGGNMSAGELEKQIDRTRELTDRNFAVSLLTISPQFHEQLYLCQWKKVPYIIFAGSFPKKNEIKMARESGAKVICYASTNEIARRMVRYGVDALIIEGDEAGGYVGRKGLNILIQEILFDEIKIPIFVAGGLFCGKLAAHMVMMGAAGVVLGSRFAASCESGAHPNFKQNFLRAKARDAVVVPQFDSQLKVVPIRTLRNGALEDFYKLKEKLLKKLKKEKISHTRAQKFVGAYWIHALRNAALKGDVEKGALMAGQSVGLIKKEQSVKEIINQLVSEIESEMKRVKGMVDDL